MNTQTHTPTASAFGGRVEIIGLDQAGCNAVARRLEKDAQPRATGEDAPYLWKRQSGQINIYRDGKINLYRDGKIAAVLSDSEEGAKVAAFITRACNSHAALVAALEGVVNSGPLNNGLRDENTMAQARAALAAAKKEGQQ